MTQGNLWGGSTEYSINSSYYLADIQTYSQYVTLAGGASGTPSTVVVSGDVSIATPANTEYLSFIMTSAVQVYSISSANVFSSIELYNNTEDSLIYVDMGGLLTTVATLSASAIVIRSLIYYYFQKPVVSNQLKLITDTPNTDIRIVGHY